MKAIELFESRMITVYHGDDFNTTSLDPKLMNNGNNQEGIGIYFSDQLSTAQAYGKNIIEAQVNIKRLLPARTQATKIGERKIRNILMDMWKLDPEAMFYFVSDWEMVQEVDDVEEYHIHAVANNLVNYELRNFQITMAETFNVSDFVESWVKHTNIDGLYHSHNDEERWFAIINPHITVFPL